VAARVSELTRSLDEALDEGTGGSLDPIIKSWTVRWIATVQSQYVEHCSDIGVHLGQAKQWLTESAITVQHEREILEHIQADYASSRHRLTGESPAPSPHGAIPVAEPGGEARDDGEPVNPPAATAPSALAVNGAPARPALPAHQDWAEPHLVAGRSSWGLVAGAILIAVGAMADTIAFHNVLELVLSTESETVAWVMAVGTTSMALVAAGTLGIGRAIRRRGRWLSRRYRPSRLPLVVSTGVWLGLGAAMFLIRWKDNATVTGLIGPATSASAPSQSNVWQALFFLAIYLISGACTLFEAERLYNPEYQAFRRLREQYNEQARRVAKAEAEKARAQEAVDRHDGDLERQRQLRSAAIADRRALGAEAANYARVLMAGMMRDPAKTGITETGPVPDISLGGQKFAGAAAESSESRPPGP
jgi:hypothetical protein